jgi:hypothetical protein
LVEDRSADAAFVGLRQDRQRAEQDNDRYCAAALQHVRLLPLMLMLVSCGQSNGFAGRIGIDE